MKNLKSDFPIFQTHPNLVYLDSAATSQKPYQVINAIKNFYEIENSNIHRGIYDLSQTATEHFENTRKKIATFIGSDNPSEIIFTRNATEAINLVSYGWARKNLKPGDIIITSEMEHHSNIVPWLRLKQEKGIEIIFLPISPEGKLNIQTLPSLLKTGQERFIKLLTLTHVSNVLGTINPIKDIISFLKQLNPNTKFLIDAAQSIPHLPINVKDLACDFLTFSSHKMLGPSGVGILWAKQVLLEEMEPLLTGSHMIQKVTKEKAIYALPPDKFESGTANIEGVIGLGAAIDYINTIGYKKINEHENTLINYAVKTFIEQKDITLFGPKNAEERIGVFSFNVLNIHPHDVAEICNRLHIAVRAGHHCAQPLMETLQVHGTVRASFYLYNIQTDIDKLKQGIQEAQKTFKRV